MARSFVVLGGDGIGPEVVGAALQIVDRLRDRHRLTASPIVHPVGGQALRKHGQPLPDFVLEDCRRHGVVLLGAVGAPAWDHLPPTERPEKALLRLRQELGLFANLRPVKVLPCLSHASPLRPERVAGVDLLFVRELTGGIYFGEPRGNRVNDQGQRGAINSEVYWDWEIERIARVAFEAARTRKGTVTSVDKSNVMETSQLWRRVVKEVAIEFPDVKLEHMLVDNCAMQIVARPTQFDVILTSNMFGDILSDEAAMLTGSIGMLPSASTGAERPGGSRGLYEPVHGSAPDIAGSGKANPLAAIGSLALMLRFSLGRPDLAERVENAVIQILEQGVRPADLALPGETVSTTQEVTQAVLAAV